MTPERLEEIRELSNKFSESTHPYAMEVILKELLAYTDALRTDLARCLEVQGVYAAQVKAMQEVCDIDSDLLGKTHLENLRLRDRVARLREALDILTSQTRLCLPDDKDAVDNIERAISIAQDDEAASQNKDKSDLSQKRDNTGHDDEAADGEREAKE